MIPSLGTGYFSYRRSGEVGLIGTEDDNRFELGDSGEGGTYLGYVELSAFGLPPIKAPVIQSDTGLTFIYNPSNFDLTFPANLDGLVAADYDFYQGFFNYRLSYSYQSVEGVLGLVVPVGGPGTLYDFDLDLAFESGDGLFPTGFLEFLGTAEIDGVVCPAFATTGGFTVYVPQGTGSLTIDPSIVPTVNSSAVFEFCFAAGSAIATPDGERAVEDLAVGDQVITQDGTAVSVKWVGRQTIYKAFARRDQSLVRIRSGALGPGVPHADLMVTSDHGMIVDGLVINASALVNHGSIDWVPMADLPERFTVYHIETEAHDVILANGAPSETFIDYAGRQAFDNYAEYVELYGADRIIPEMPQPRITASRMVPQAIKRRIETAAPWIEDIVPLSA